MMTARPTRPAMSRILTLFLAFAGLLAPPATAFAAAATSSAALARVEAHFDGVRTMTADFVQTAPNGAASQGRLILARPGKARFQYEPSIPVLIVADGKSLFLVDYEVSQVQRYPIGETPLGALLGPASALRQRVDIVSSDADTSQGLVTIRARDRKHPEYGQLTLFFQPAPAAPGGLTLYGWTVLDAQGKTTRVQLSNIKLNPAIDANAFRFRDPRGLQAGPRGR